LLALLGARPKVHISRIEVKKAWRYTSTPPISFKLLLNEAQVKAHVLPLPNGHGIFLISQSRFLNETEQRKGRGKVISKATVPWNKRFRFMENRDTKSRN
jgi:hypothetical protein